MWIALSVLERLKRDPVLFAEEILGFKPFPYQAKILRDQSLRIVSCLGRQTGKTTTIAIKAIHFAWTHPKTTTLITSPSLRQSMIMFDRILSFVYNNPYPIYKNVVINEVFGTTSIVGLAEGWSFPYQICWIAFDNLHADGYFHVKRSQP